MFAVREEEQERVRKEEEENWSKALSGELSGPRPAALGAAESVTIGSLLHIDISEACEF